MRTVWQSFIVLFLIFNVKYVFFFGLGTTYIIFLFFLMLFFIERRMIISKNHVFLLSMSVFLFSYVLFSSLYNEVYHLSYMKMYVFIVLSYIVSPLIYRYLGNNKPGYFFELLGYAALINAIVIMLMFFFYPIKELYLKFVILELANVFGEDVFDSLLTLRMVGVTGFSAYSTAFCQMLCIILYYANILFFRNDKKLKKLDYIIIFMVVLSSLIVSRSTIVGIVFLSMLIAFDNNNRKENIIFVLSSILLFLIFIWLSSFMLTENEFQFFSNWVAEFFLSGKDTGSLDANLAMFKYSIYDFTLIGDSMVSSSDGGYYMNTDVGYFRLLFSSGFLGFILLFLLLTVTILCSSNSLKHFLFGLFIIAYILVFMFKGYIVQDAIYLFIIASIINLEFKNIKVIRYR